MQTQIHTNINTRTTCGHRTVHIAFALTLHTRTYTCTPTCTCTPPGHVHHTQLTHQPQENKPHEHTFVEADEYGVHGDGGHVLQASCAEAQTNTDALIRCETGVLMCMLLKSGVFPCLFAIGGMYASHSSTQHIFKTSAFFLRSARTHKVLPSNTFRPCPPMCV